MFVTLLKITGTPYLFNTYSNPVDPNRGADLAPAFQVWFNFSNSKMKHFKNKVSFFSQAQYGTYGAELVAYFGTGNL